jgi:hypothetical protein
VGRFNHIQNSFASGELSKNLEARTDIKEYAHGAAVVRNMKVLRHGGVTKREGLRYGRSVQSPGFNNLSIFNFRPGGLNFLVVMRPFNDSGGNIAGFLDNPIVAYYINQDNFLEPVNVVYPTGTNFEFLSYGLYETNIAVLPGRWTTVHYGVNLIINHSSGEVAPFILTYKKVSGVDTIYVNHFMPSGYKDTVTSVDILNDPGQYLAAGLRVPYQSPNTDTTHTMTLTASTGALTTIGNKGVVTSSKAFFDTYINTLAVAKYNMRPFYMAFEIPITTTTSNVIYICVYNYLTPTTANFVVLNSVGSWPSPTTSAAWRISAWGGNLGYPRLATIFQERLILAGSPAFPDTVWCSYAGNIFLFDARRQADGNSLDSQPKFFNYKGAKTTADPFDLAVASDEVSVITWINSGSDIRVGTLDAEFAVGNVDQLFSDSNSFVKKVTNIGGTNIPSISAEGITMFVAKDKKRLFSIEEGGTDTGYQTKNLTLLSGDILTKRLEEVYSTYPTGTTYNAVVINGVAWSRFESTLWLWTSLNEVIGLTFASDAGTLAWHRHDFHTAEFTIQNCCVAQNRFGTEDNLWVLAKTPAGEYRLYYKNVYSHQIDMNNTSPNGNDLPVFLDNSRVMPGTNGSLISGVSADFVISESRFCIKTSDFMNLHLGHPIKFTTAPAGSLPSQLVLNTTYYAIPVKYSAIGTLPETNKPYSGRTSIRFATTLANALAGTYIPLTNYTTPASLVLDTRIDVNSPEYQVWPSDASPNSEIGVVVDGVYIGDYTVDANGTFILPNTIKPSNYMVEGFSYNTVLRTMDINAGSQLETSLESMERIDRVMVMLYKSKDGYVGGKDEIYEQIEYDMVAPNITILESKKATVLMPNGPDQETFVEVRSNSPLPLTINGMVMRGTEHD